MRTRKRAPRRYVRKTRAYRKKRSYRRVSTARGRNRKSRNVVNQGRYYTCWETIARKKILMPDGSTDDPENSPNVTRTLFDLDDLIRVKDLSDNNYEWFRIKRAVVKYTPLQNRGCWDYGQMAAQTATSVIPAAVCIPETPNIISYTGSADTTGNARTQIEALARPYAKRHSLFSQYGFSRSYIPYVVSTRKILNDASASSSSSVPMKEYRKWYKCNDTNRAIDWFGPMFYTPCWKNFVSANPKLGFNITIAVQVELKGIKNDALA